MKRIDRRGFTVTLASLALGSSCGAVLGEGSDGRLTARPRRGVTSVAGERALELDRSRDAFLRVPASDKPVPLLVLLHGAGGRGQGVLRRVAAALDDAPVAVLAPDSRGGTWDAIQFSFGRDVAFLNRALERVFETVAVDPDRVAIGGFSDGATYALSLGLINGDLFRRIVAFSPGFLVEGHALGKPRIFVSHGQTDEILPIDRTSRRLVPLLRTRGYVVTYREFAGGHEVPDAVAHEALKWIAER